MEHSGHLEGMLDRDQRTAKLRVFDHSANLVTRLFGFQEDAVLKCWCPAETRRSAVPNTSYLACRKTHSTSVKNVLVVICLSLVALPIVSSMPIDSSRLMSKQKWVDPCEATKSDEGDGSPPSAVQSAELTKIAQEADSALQQATSFKYNFSEQTFHKTVDEVDSDLKEQKVDYLKELSKFLEAELTTDYLNSLKVEEVLPDVYHSLQLLAVALEQVVWDQEDNKGGFTSDFGTAEHQLKRVLCEMQQVMVEHELPIKPDVTRDAIAESERNIDDSTKRKQTHWMIYRDYMKALIYVKTVFNHLSKNLSA